MQLDKKVVLALGSSFKDVSTTATRRRHSREASASSSASKAALVVLHEAISDMGHIH